MGYMQDHKAIYQQILSLLEHHLGPNSEIVLHDLTLPMTVPSSTSETAISPGARSETA